MVRGGKRGHSIKVKFQETEAPCATHSSPREARSQCPCWKTLTGQHAVRPGLIVAQEGVSPRKLTALAWEPPSR